MEVDLILRIISGLLDLLLSHKNRLGNLHKDDKAIPFKKKKGEKAYLYSIKRCDYKLTMARSIFKDKKKSGCLMCLKAFMSLGKRRGYSKALAMWAECPLWNFLMKEFQGMTALSTSSRGDQMHC